MAPTKKREKESPDGSGTAVNTNGTNGQHGCASTPTTPSATNGGAMTPTAASVAGVAVPVNVSTAESVKLNGHQQEQELFLQAFEKPTQIYRYLRNRHETNPIFLNRTLSYMKERMSRNNKNRATFKINSILDRIMQKSEAVTQNYLHIIYDSLHEKLKSEQTELELQEQLLCQAGENVCVETTLYKITRSKRKDSTLDFQELLSKSSQIVYNPKERIGEHATISIPLQTMRPMGEQHTLYKLLFRIKMLQAACNDENAATPNKRSRSNEKMYGSELILYEKSSGFITEGEYEAMLQPLNSSSIKSFSPKKCTWETMPDSYIPLSLTYDVYQQSPMLKFHLTLSNEELPSVIAAPELQRYVTHLNYTTSALDVDADNNNCSHKNGNNNGVICKSTPEHIQIVYNFMYSNNTRQQTEYTQELNCPWCGLDCLRLYALLKHLKLCHARFNFTYQPAGNGARIDVTINDAYDGSYAGSPYDLAGPSGSSFARTCGPVRRTSVTSLMVCRPRRQKTCLDEFLELDEDDITNQRSYITGHNRLYHHTETCLPVHPKELDIDSEGESDPLWLRQKTIQMIDEFSDVNEGEKELMKLWNLHVMRNGFVGDCQLPLACEMFLDAKGHEIVRKNLYRNFILHMCSLFDYGLIAADTVYKTVQKLQGLLSRYAAGQELMQRQREAQLKYWLEVGMHKKQDEQKHKSPQKQSTASGAGDGATATASGSGASGAMQPPKRMPANIKRATSSSTAALSSTVSLDSTAGNGAAGTSNSKNVAKKSADQPLANMRERRSDHGLKRSFSGARLSAPESRSATLPKRKLSAKDNASPAGALTKRLRYSDHGVGGSTVTRNSTISSGSNKSNNNHHSLPNSNKRLITRRRSTTERNSNMKANNSGGGGSGGTTSAQAHGLRTRLSMPAKYERR
ncbi:polycomb protein Su(z)12 isoform X2 [Scaptodrosophila lebanonensis]|uniref:Polycomb protein Su(Z)12 isoform X2 n=1 Tax=Drosophila lebanonensis TaxID=7225 RepID=A0A6J2TCX0_DROLE|nr:polycomb protein Su(z)12 isoform X2 [Scaptodrosophila lebanonensis]